MQILEHIPLKAYTTFKTGGPARFFVVVKNVSELTEVVIYAQNNSLPIFILGGGSNILVQDNGVRGLVIKIEISGIEEQKISDEETEVRVGAGENWDNFVAYTVSKNLYGLENLSYIPGTVGAAPVQNIGAYGVEVKNVISHIEVLNTETLKPEKIFQSDCLFNYRDSLFKKPEGKKYVITHVIFKLSHTKKLVTDYKDIKEYIAKNNLQESEITLKKMRKIVIDIRKRKLPDVALYGTAGSFFKNPVIKKSEYDELKKIYSDMPSFSVSSEQVKVPAGWLLDKLCGFRGYRNGDVGVYQNQALVLVNFGNSTSKEILDLSEKMISCVKEKTKIILEKEVQVI